MSETSPGTVRDVTVDDVVLSTPRPQLTMTDDDGVVAPNPPSRPSASPVSTSSRPRGPSRNKSTSVPPTGVQFGDDDDRRVRRKLAVVGSATTYPPAATDEAVRRSWSRQGRSSSTPSCSLIIVTKAAALAFLFAAAFLFDAGEGERESIRHYLFVCDVNNLYRDNAPGVLPSRIPGPNAHAYSSMQKCHV